MQESRHADEGQRLAAAGSQREVSLRHPSQRQPAAVGQNTGQWRRTHAPDRTGWLQLLSVSRLLRPTAARILKQLLEVRGRRNAHHRIAAPAGLCSTDADAPTPDSSHIPTAAPQPPQRSKVRSADSTPTAAAAPSDSCRHRDHVTHRRSCDTQTVM